MNKLLKIAAIALALWAQIGAAAVPEEMVRNTSREVLDVIKKEKSDKRIRELIEQRILPSFDFARMTALAVGKHWRDASAEQKALLTEEFKTLLVRTYSSALTAYKTQSVDVKPLKADDAASDVTVQTEVSVANAQPVAISYSLRKKDTTWKVYDVSVGGVSLVTNYRGTFNETIAAGGIDNLIKMLKEKNLAGGTIKADKQ